MTDEVPPVVIVGGGPVGLSLAEELAFHHVRVVVVEPRAAVDHSRPRAKTTSVRTMEHFRRWGIADQLREKAPLRGDWSQRVTFVQTVTGREITHVDGCLGLDAPPELSPEPAQQVTQPLVEELLRADLANRQGVELLWGWQAIEVSDGPDHAEVVVVNDAGEQRTIAARWVAGADGPRSVVRRAMGAHYEGAAAGRPNVNITFRSTRLADLIPHPGSIHYWVLNPESPGVVGPLDHDGTWWAISTGTPHVDDVEHAAEIVRALVGADIDVDVLATDPWQARTLLANTYRAGHLFIVGDAAHQNPPWGGHGFNTGVGDAVNLGWKLAAVIDGWAPDELLDSYGSERRPVEQQTIDLASSNMASLSIDLSNPLLMSSGDAFEAARAELGPVIKRVKSPEFHSVGLVLGYGYGPHSAEQAPTPAEYSPMIAAGNRLPHRHVDGHSLYDLLGPWFTAIGSAEAVAPLMAEAVSRGIPIVHLESADASANADADVVLVRPDQHIAWAGKRTADPGEVLDAAVRGFTPGAPASRTALVKTTETED
ncbi:FAD-dependent monooxygenase [Agreia sp.]|uniref:FAD-dependent monooxygenase n=1 Tax=Agreia sp. TaxID=1872416 RepID=UPI0035BC628D